MGVSVEGRAVGDLVTSPVITRCGDNPLLSAQDVPYGATLVFNVGVAKYQGKYVMVFRDDYRDADNFRKVLSINIGMATSDDGISWHVAPKPCFSLEDEDILWAYDPRITVIEGRVYMCFAVDTHHGVRGGIAVTDDFESFEVLSISAPDNRNMVLFPEKIGGRYLRLERPFPVYGRAEAEQFDIWSSDSPDCRYWGNTRLVLGAESVPFCNSKIGPAAPPVKTDRGWLTTIHTVDKDDSRGKNGWEPTWKKRYCAGIMLLDLDDPTRVIGLGREPLIAPEAEYEVAGGFRNNVIFPGGMILEDSGEVKIYYGAADTVTCLATADVGDLLDLCKPL